MPIIPKGALTAALGLIGAVIMPHNLYLHSSLVLTRKIDTRNKNQVKEANIYNTLESGFSLFISFVISAAVISTFAAWKDSPNYGKFKSGYIGLQDHDNPIWFKNIKIKKL